MPQKQQNICQLVPLIYFTRLKIKQDWWGPGSRTAHSGLVSCNIVKNVETVKVAIFVITC